jgi:ubiquitin carboxyl-terminal hydrolase L3
MPNWVPLEANPEVLDSYAAKLGALDIPSVFRFADVFGLEDDLLAFIPQPVLGVLLLFPITAETEKIREQGEIVETTIHLN